MYSNLLDKRDKRQDSKKDNHQICLGQRGIKDIVKQVKHTNETLRTEEDN